MPALGSSYCTENMHKELETFHVCQRFSSLVDKNTNYSSS